MSGVVKPKRPGEQYIEGADDTEDEEALRRYMLPNKIELPSSGQGPASDGFNRRTKRSAVGRIPDTITATPAGDG